MARAKINRGGRPSDYTPETVAEFLAQLANGNSLRTVCAMDGMPGMSTVMRWLGEHEPFRDQYARAVAERREVRKEQLLDIPVDPDIEPARGRLLSDNIKWVLAKEEPKKYGDKIQQEHSGPDGGPIETRYAKLDDAQLDELILAKAKALGVVK